MRNYADARSRCCSFGLLYREREQKCSQIMADIWYPARRTKFVLWRHVGRWAVCPPLLAAVGMLRSYVVEKDCFLSVYIIYFLPHYRESDYSEQDELLRSCVALNGSRQTDRRTDDALADSGSAPPRSPDCGRPCPKRVALSVRDKRSARDTIQL